MAKINMNDRDNIKRLSLAEPTSQAITRLL